MKAGIEEWSENAKDDPVKSRTMDKMKNICQEFSRLVIFEACNNVGNSMVVTTQ